MFKKFVKVVLVMLMVLGVVVAASNVLEKDLPAAPGKWVDYHPEEPDCYGPGNRCYDMTSTSTVTE